MDIILLKFFYLIVICHFCKAGPPLVDYHSQANKQSLSILHNLFDLALDGQRQGSLLGEQASSPCLLSKQAIFSLDGQRQPCLYP